MANPKPPARRKHMVRPATPKVSPLRGMPVDRWIQLKCDGWRSIAVRKILGLVTEAVPDAVLSVKWGQPVYELSGPFAFVKAASAHVTLGFWRGAELRAYCDLLEGGDVMRHIKIRSVAALETIDVAGRFWCVYGLLS